MTFLFGGELLFLIMYLPSNYNALASFAMPKHCGFYCLHVLFHIVFSTYTILICKQVGMRTTEVTVAEQCIFGYNNHERRNFEKVVFTNRFFMCACRL